MCTAGSRRRGDGSTWGLVGILASTAAAWLIGAWHIGQNKAKKAGNDTSYLTRMLAVPLKYTEHAQCRMDCRSDFPYCTLSLLSMAVIL